MKNFKTKLAASAVVAAVLMSSPVMAGHQHEGPAMHYDENIKVEAGQAVIQVQGLVCQVCASKAEGALKSLDSVEDVDVDLKKQFITIDLEDGKSLDVEAVAKQIRSKGFNPYMAYALDADGNVIMQRIK